jgi:hypothetical protein
VQKSNTRYPAAKNRRRDNRGFFEKKVPPGLSVGQIANLAYSGFAEETPGSGKKLKFRAKTKHPVSRR